MGDYLNLTEYIQKHPHKGFDGQPHYYEDGDYLTFFAKEDRCYSVRINELLTIYVSSSDRSSLVGCKIKGIVQVVQYLERLKVVVSDSDISIGLLFTSVAAVTNEDDTRKDVISYGSQLPAAQIPRSSLPFSSAA